MCIISDSYCGKVTPVTNRHICARTLTHARCYKLPTIRSLTQPLYRHIIVWINIQAKNIVAKPQLRSACGESCGPCTHATHQLGEDVVTHTTSCEGMRSQHVPFHQLRLAHTDRRGVSSMPLRMHMRTLMVAASEAMRVQWVRSVLRSCRWSI